MHGYKWPIICTRENQAGQGGLLRTLVAFLDPLVQRLVLNLELLEVDQMQPVGELLLLAQRALELAQDVAPVDVGETQLLDLLVLAVLLLLEALDELAGDGLACSG